MLSLVVLIGVLAFRQGQCNQILLDVVKKTQQTLGGRCVSVVGQWRGFEGLEESDFPLQLFEDSPNVGLDLCSSIVMEWTSRPESFELPATMPVVFIGGSKVEFESWNEIARMTSPTFITISNGRPQYWTKTSPLSRTVKLAKDQLSSNTLPIDFDGHEIKASAFPFKPYSDLNFKTGLHRGFEYNIAATVTKSLNLKLTVAMPSDGIWWGDESPPGSGNFTGIFGDVQFRRADISWGNLFVIPKRIPYIGFSDWYVMEKYCVMVQEPGFYPKIYALIKPFEFRTWMLILFTQASAILFYLAFTFWSGIGLSVPDVITSVISASVMQSQRILLSLRGLGVQLMTLTFLLGMMVLCLGYSSSLVSLLTVDVSQPPLDSVKDLVTASKSENIMVTNCCDAIKKTLESSLIESHRELANILEYHSNNKDAMIGVQSGGHATLNAENVLKFGERQHLIQKQGAGSGVHIMKECFGNVAIAYALQKNSPIRQSFNRKLQQTRQAGLIDKYIQDAADDLGLKGLTGLRKRQARKPYSLTLTEVKGPLFILLVLQVLTCLCFLAEKLWPLLKGN